jgi:hypothetical protein
MIFDKRKRQILIALIFFLGLILLGKAILFVLALQSQEIKPSLPANNSDSADTFPGGIENLPAGFPVYQDSEFNTFAVSDDGNGMSFIWESEDDTDLVFEYFKSRLRINGWTLSNDSSVGSSSAVSFEKNGNTGFLGVFKGSSGKTIISVTIRKP